MDCQNYCLFTFFRFHRLGSCLESPFQEAYPLPTSLLPSVPSGLPLPGFITCSEYKKENSFGKGSLEKFHADLYPPAALTLWFQRSPGGVFPPAHMPQSLVFFRTVLEGLTRGWLKKTQRDALELPGLEGSEHT